VAPGSGADLRRGRASGAEAPIEIEVRDGLGLSGIESGPLVDVEGVVGVEGEPGRRIAPFLPSIPGIHCTRFAPCGAQVHRNDDRRHGQQRNAQCEGHRTNSRIHAAIIGSNTLRSSSPSNGCIRPVPPRETLRPAFSAGITHSNLEIPLSIDVFIDCANGGLGENVIGSGTLHMVTQTVLTSSGNIVFTSHAQAQGSMRSAPSRAMSIASVV
jgi:hypothetical protein